MRTTRIIGILLAGLLLVPGACARTTIPAIPVSQVAASLPESALPEPEAPVVTPVHLYTAIPSLAQPAPANRIPEPGPNEVWLWGNEYKPSVLVVPVGTTVTWVGKDDEGHDVESAIPGMFHGSVAPGDTFKVTFDTPGTYGYYCLCGLLFGTIIVQ